MNDQQKRIYQGLTRIGEEAAAFYADGVEILNSQRFKTSTHILAHFAREIDSALRETFSTTVEKEKARSVLNNEDLGDLKKHKSYISSILASLDVSLGSQLARDWINVATQFYSFAHRDSKRKIPRDHQVGIDLWTRYEEVLLKLIGGYFALQKRIERIVSLDQPTEDILDRLPLLLQQNGLKIQFFKGLSNPKWLAPLFDRDYFSPDKIPSEYPAPDREDSRVVPNWIEIQYLEKVALENYRNPSPQVTQILTSIIHNFLSEREKGGINNRNIDLPFLRLIFFLPAREIGEEHFVHMSRSLGAQNMLASYIIMEEGLSNFLISKEKGLTLELLRVILSPIESDGAYGKRLHSTVDSTAIKDNLIEKAEPLLSVCGFDLIELLLELLGVCDDDYLTAYSYIDVSEVSFDHDHEFDVEGGLALLCKFTIFFLEKYQGDIVDKVRELLYSDISLFRRIALHLLTKRYGTIGEVFWEIPYNPFTDYQIDNDLARFLKHNAKTFKVMEVNQLIQWTKIFEERLNSIKERFTEEQSDALMLHQRRRRLLLLQENTDKGLQSLLAELAELDQYEIDDNSLDFRHIRISTSWGVEVPESTNALLNDTPVLIAEYLRTFDEKDEFGRGNIEGAGYGLKQDIIRYPSKYFENFDLFSQIRPEFFSYFIDAVNEIRKEGAFSYWREFLFLAETFLQREDFWLLHRCRGIMSTFGWLLRDNLVHDDTAIDMDNMELVKGVLLTALARLEPEGDLKLANKKVDVFNDPYPVMLTALLYYALRMARNVYSEDRVRWEPEIKTIFDEGITAQLSRDVFAVIGQFLRNFYYLDQQWVDGNFNKIFPMEQIYFDISLSYYVKFNGVSTAIHKKLDENGYFERAIKSNFVESNAGERLISHICIGYQLGWSSIREQGGLLQRIVEEMNLSAINHMIHHFWIKKSRDNELPQNDQVVRSIWRQLYNKIKKNTQGKEISELTSNLSKWVGSITSIDQESVDWIKLVARNCHIGGNEHFFFEGLSRHVENTTQQVGDLLIYYSENTPKQIHHFATKDLERGLEVIYEELDLTYANTVCHSLGEIGYQRLYDIYNRYN